MLPPVLLRIQLLQWPDLFEVPSDMVSEINKEEYDLRPEYAFSGTLKQQPDDTSFDDDEKVHDDEYD